MSVTPPELGRIKLGSLEPTRCSPEVSDDFRGVALAGPRRIVLDRPDEVFPVCGTYQVTAAFLNRFTSMPNEIVIVVVDAATHEPRARNLVRRDFTPEPGRYEGAPEELAERVTTGWFNVDLFAWEDPPPRRAGRYHVFAVIGELTSNVLTVEVAAP